MTTILSWFTGDKATALFLFYHVFHFVIGVIAAFIAHHYLRRENEILFALWCIILLLILSLH